MNRIAILLIVLLAAALAILLFYRGQTAGEPHLDAAGIRRHPVTALDRVDRLLHQARDGVAATEQARSILRTIIDDGTDPQATLEARRRLVELELLLGNPHAASDLLLEAIQAHPGSAEVPRLLFELALLQDELDRPGEAREVLRRLIHLFPDHPLAIQAERLVELAMKTSEGDRP